MAHKILSSVSILLAVALLAASSRPPAFAQTNEAPTGGPDVQRRCTTVALTSDSPLIPLRLIEPYVQQRADFQASKLALTEQSESADAIVTLTQSGERDTHIEVSSRITGRHVSALTLWTDYPGMVASDVMEQLKVVCALPVARAFQQSREPGSGTGKPSAEQDEIKSLVARDNHRRGFKHFAGRVGFYAGGVLVDATTVAGYVALAAAMAAN